MGAPEGRSITRARSKDLRGLCLSVNPVALLLVGMGFPRTSWVIFFCREGGVVAMGPAGCCRYLCAQGEAAS